MITISLKNITAAIFDMDGTMVDNMPYHKKAWQVSCERHGITLSDEDFQEKISGKKNIEIFTILFGKELSAELVLQYTEEKEAIYREIYAKDVMEIQDLPLVLPNYRKEVLCLLLRQQHLQKIVNLF